MTKFFQSGAGCEEYKNIRDFSCVSDKKEFIEDMWKLFEPYAENGFLENTRMDSQYFTANMWEMYLAYVFLVNNYELQQRLLEGPDFQIHIIDIKVWIEATIAKIGNGSDAVPPLKYDEVYSVPEENMIFRITNSIDSKYKKYLSYLQKGILGADDPFVIAINSSDFGLYPDLTPPIILRSLFALGKYQITINTTTLEKKSSIQRRPTIFKRNNAPIDTKFFSSDAYSGISGILYTKNNILDVKTPFGSDLLFIYNPFAKNPIPKKMFNFIQKEIFANEKGFLPLF